MLVEVQAVLGLAQPLERQPRFRKPSESVQVCLGCKIPARRELDGKYLEAAYQRVKANVDKELHVSLGAALILVALATDGWRKRAAAQGAPLMNAML